MTTGALDWDKFARLPGSQERNFEALCRSLVRLHYGSCGDFRAVANQPGVEFHLQLRTICALGEPGRWLGWQCRWYQLPSGKALGTTRRKKIVDAIRKTEKVLPELTDWILWTRHTLTAGDQKWFRTIKTRLRLALWTGAEVEEHLTGNALLLRATYFDELVVTPAILQELHQLAVASVQHRWLPDAHQEVDAERTIRRMLGEANAWNEMIQVADRLRAAAQAIASERHVDFQGSALDAFVTTIRATAETLTQTQQLLASGDFALLRQTLLHRGGPPERAVIAVPRRLRAIRAVTSFEAANALADLRLAQRLLGDMDGFLTARSVALLADAGGGKTQLSAQLTDKLADRPAGILLHGRDLHQGQNLDDLARRVILHGHSLPSMQALVAALDAAGQRAQRRLPLVIDGLNEAEDPRDWKSPLAALDRLLEGYPNVLLVVTLRTGARRAAEQDDWHPPRESASRTEFAEMALPAGWRTLTMEGFGQDAPAALRRYFQYFRISPDADIPTWLLDHPLTLRIFCEVTNPTRNRNVGSEAMPRSLTALFDRYLQNAADRIGQLAPQRCRYCAQDVRRVIDEIGLRLVDQRTRELDESDLRRAVGDQDRLWADSIVRLLEQEGVILRVEGDSPGRYRVMAAYDALGGYMAANSLLCRLGRAAFGNWAADPNNLKIFAGSHAELHPLAVDIFRSLVGLVPRRFAREQFWMLLHDELRNAALVGAVQLEREFLDHATVAAIGNLVRKVDASTDILIRLTRIRGAPDHPLNANFLDAELRKMSNADRDLRWTEWIRGLHEELRHPQKPHFHEFGRGWQHDASRDASDRLHAKWAMWLLTTTSRELRDTVTRALYWFGRGAPETLFSLTVDSLQVSDPYVSERMLAASYGVAMVLHSRGDTKVLVAFARELYRQFFAPAAPAATTHVLTREYARRILQAAVLCQRGLFSRQEMRRMTPPFQEGGLRVWQELEMERVEIHGRDSPFRMDFENYTLGRLAPTRSNYDYNNPQYRKVRAQILWRIEQLGWSAARFGAIDERIENRRSFFRRSPDERQTDRYGKKYSWIAYHEMRGLLADEGVLQIEDERTSCVDIDPSFPRARAEEKLITEDFLGRRSVSTRHWIANGATPSAKPYFRLRSVADVAGPWRLLDGFFTQEDHARGRRIFFFVRSFLVSQKQATGLRAALEKQSMRGRWLPEKPRVIYTYAGEIPWAETYPKLGATTLRFVTKEEKMRVKRRRPVYFLDGKRLDLSGATLARWRFFGKIASDTPENRQRAEQLSRVQERMALVEVEETKRETRDFDVLLPVYDFGWEGSTLETRAPVGPVLGKELASDLRLSALPESLDLADSAGRLATYGTSFRTQSFNNSQTLFYLREDLLRAFLRRRQMTLVYVTWGEREFGGKVAENERGLAGVSHQVFHTVESVSPRP